MIKYKRSLMNNFSRFLMNKKLYASFIFISAMFFSTLMFGGDNLVTLHPVSNNKLSINTSPEHFNLNFSTFIGGTNNELTRGSVTDSQGNIYITGQTFSSDFPTLNAYNATYGGNGDVFVNKFSPNGTLIFSTFLGGSGSDSGNAITLGSTGNIFIAGTTGSINFPLVNAYYNKLNGTNDAFIAELDSTGNLVNSTYIGGTGAEDGLAIALDTSGNIYLAGDTLSSNFPIVNGNATYSGGSLYGDTFVATFNTSGVLSYSTYMGGSGDDKVTGIGLDTNSNIYVGGYTTSSNFPTQTAIQTILQGSEDAFLFKLNSTGLEFSSYFGGTDYDYGYAFTVDNQGNSYMTGLTRSNDFPLKNANQTTFNNGDAFVSKFDSSGTLLFSTYLGGIGEDYGNAITVDNSGNIYVAGSTVSSDFPVKNPTLTGYSSYGNDDVFIAVFNSTGTMTFGTLFYGTGTDLAFSITHDLNNNIFVSGATTSTDFPLKNEYSSTNYGGYFGDVFVSKFSPYIVETTTSVSVTTSTSSSTSTSTSVSTSSSVSVSSNTNSSTPASTPSFTLFSLLAGLLIILFRKNEKRT